MQISKDKTEETTKGQLETQEFKQHFSCPPKRITIATAVVNRMVTRYEFEKQVTISGFVVICCKKKVSNNPQEKAHKKWAISAEEVMSTLQEYVAKKLFDSVTQVKLETHLKDYDGLSQKGVSFKLRGNIEDDNSRECKLLIEHKLMEVVKYSPEKLREHLMTHCKQKLVIERLVHQPIPSRR
jgi:hypothetical protein